MDLKMPWEIVESIGCSGLSLGNEILLELILLA